MPTIKDLIGLDSVGYVPMFTNWDEDSRVRWKLRQLGLDRIDVDEARAILYLGDHDLKDTMIEHDIEFIILDFEKP